jgi:hypothetical protein
MKVTVRYQKDSVYDEDHSFYHDFIEIKKVNIISAHKYFLSNFDNDLNPLINVLFSQLIK